MPEPQPIAASGHVAALPAADLDRAAEIFLAVRPRLFGIAYRMLGSAAEAEDLVQEVWLRWQATDRTVVLDPPAFLATTAVHLAINALNSARTRRESYIGPWLPEPIDLSADPSLGAERNEALSLAILLLLEKLTPTERAAYVLREAFDYAYNRIAEILSLTEANTRQLVSRARKHIADSRRTNAAIGDAAHQRLLAAFIHAAQTGDQAALESLFAADVVSIADSGGIVTAARVPLFGRERVARALAAIAAKLWRDVTFSTIVANGRPSMLITSEGQPFAVVDIQTGEHGISQMLWVMNPAKLTSITPTK
ncbi:MAG: RNA polymerase sigma-70 factor [Edaphobacter sp.]|uniref:RNA polymerase sigma-70 factor n=1 Tax=Edaphobacter sp. TaxID=1934404 RepID=UPI0023A55C68|nr:RNA polymerase sigma-70 factor [Edaphobacter sp.]MDE1178806.1 RNA polymerase sigma-70 factor [Edaphobacter sp.]